MIGRRDPRSYALAAPPRPSAHVGSYFFMDSGNPTLDRVTVAVVGFPFGAMLGALLSAGNPIAIIGAGALTSTVLYSAGGAGS